MNAKILGNGIYTLAEAATYLQVSRRQLSYWFGRRTTRDEPLFNSDYSFGEIANAQVISFLDLVQAMGVGWLRENHVSLQSIRKVYPQLQQFLSTSHPFSHKNLLTDSAGIRIFVEVGEETGDKALIELMKGISQHVMPDILEPYLKRLHFDPQKKLANRWDITDGVIVDPARRQGKPIVEACGLSAEILAGAYFANGQDSVATADWYGVRPEDVEIACAFYRQYCPIAA